MTKKEYFTILLDTFPTDHELYEEVNAFLSKEIERLSAEKKPTPKQIEHEELRRTIYEAMEAGKHYTISEMIKELEVCAELSNQKVSAMMRILIKNGQVERMEEKGKAYFTKI